MSCRKLPVLLLGAVLALCLVPMTGAFAASGSSAVKAATVSGLDGSPTSKAASASSSKAKAAAKRFTMKAVLSKSQRTITVTASGTRLKGATEVYFPTWTAKGGQDDLVWHKAKRKGGAWVATISVSKHASAGVCHIHGYYTVNGRQRFMGARKVRLDAPTADQVSVSATGNGWYAVQVSGVYSASGVKQVSIPSWTKAKGQDDVLWHRASKQKDGSWKSTIAASRHGGKTGQYLSHAYVTGKNGIRAKVGAVSQKVVAKDYAYLTGKAGTGSRVLYVKNPTAKPVKVRVWSKTGGKDDARTYKASTSGSNLWKATIDCTRLKHSGSVNAQVLVGGEVVRTLTFKATKADLTKSGDPELDRIVKNLVDKRIGRNGNALRRAFNYVASYPYINGSKYPTGNWSVPFAKEMYRNHGGNCYRYAALFCWLARELGYDAKVVSGAVPSTSAGWAPHGWVEIRISGKTYVFDPDMAAAIPYVNWYYVTYAQAPVAYRK